ncbi:HAMP domain-containing sensor histidine kinase [Saccharibacillus sp. CPCC 101409]|uniref:sensor histidine kinase n=1 Tax=Saccharibacillus sp. CPCC 101409 TaxID=3058041 RepID=UPI0026725CC7|nr:HAMP domain-containing sensor histidine kinase [Saccharibacillus sp. CPCC 101409]MDO3412759.1 HAMP domain-containing sensor histidine kinase [Saccharibacillus sp. CPCC 101409]
MKSIYSRLVFTFMGVVAVSFVLTFLLSDWVYESGPNGDPGRMILGESQRMAHILSEVPDDLLQDVLDSFGSVQLELLVAAEDGGELRVRRGGPPAASSLPDAEADGAEAPALEAPQSDSSSGSGRRSPDWNIPASVKDSIFDGETYRSLGTGEAGTDPGFIGVPFERGEVRYALFVRPTMAHPSQAVPRQMLIALAIMIVIGTLLFLFAARLISNPLRRLSEATRRVAAGDYNASVALARRDEIGRLGEDFNQMTAELSKIEAMRQEFVSNVSHEIQTPLTSIRGFARALQSDPAEAERREYLNIIDRESERLSKLSANLLKLASLDTVRLNLKPLRLDEQIRRSAASCAPLWSARSLELSADLERADIVGDEDLLSQVWLNLLSNAIKFTPEGGELFLGAELRGGEVIVTVRDTGQGIPAEDVPHVFDRFYKADSSRSAKAGGSGLGLSIVQKIVRLHGGRVDIESEPGRGTAVSVTLKLAGPGRPEA